MKLNNRGWGYRMMAFIMFVLVAFLLVAIYYIYKYYDRMKSDYNRVERTNYMVVIKWKR